MKRKITIVAILLSFFCAGLHAQIPRVYKVENTGAGFPLPPLPTLNQLPIVDPLPDPFMWSNGSGRSTNFSDWSHRRSEIKAEIENYEIGIKPPRPDTITATWTPGATPTTGTLQVIVTRNGQTLTLNSNVSLPAGTGPFPAVIGMNNLNGSIPADIFTSRNIARITFSHNQVTTYGGTRPTDPYFRLYPEFGVDDMGQYSAWAWGVSRIIDGLELVQANLPVDLSHLAVTGCSYAGKMALFAGAFDERIALTIAQESGGGGAPAWRVSETIGDVEKLGATDHNWFRESMFQFAGLNVSRLPHDHHELMAMVAPRALLVTGNTDFTWLANPSTYVSARAAHEVWKNFGVSDRFGFYIDGQHGHCAIPTAQRPAIEAFVDKFMLDKNEVNTDTVTVHPYGNLDYLFWYKWWGTGNPTFPDEGTKTKIWLEAECGTVGSNWEVHTDPTASKGSYVTIKAGLNSTAAAPQDIPANQIILPFTIDSAGQYNFLARVIGPTADDDSYWVRVDNGAFVSANGLTSGDWVWGRLTIVNLTPGEHTLTIAYREDGAKIDKVLITNSNASVITPEFPGINCGSVPVVTPNQSFSVSEAVANGHSFGNILATDADEGTVFQKWKITGGTAASAFAINATTGELTLIDNSSLDFDSATAYTVTVTVNDGYFTSIDETVTVNLTNENDNTPVVSPDVIKVSEAASAVVETAAATDKDDNNQPGFTQLRNWRILGGTGSAYFVINSNTGGLTINPNNTLDFEKKTGFTLRLQVSDGKFTSAVQEVTVQIVNENDNRPEVKGQQKFTISTWTADGDVVGTAVALDGDDKNEPGFTTFGNWQITSGSGASVFAIDPATGQITIKNSSVFHDLGKGTYSLFVTVSDGLFTSRATEINFTVTSKVNICYNGQTLSLSRDKVAAYLARGATPGECNTTAARTIGATTIENSIKVYPNPAKDRITLSLGNNELNIQKIELIDVSGRVMFQMAISGRTGILNVNIPRNKISKGIYLLRMQGDKVVTQKVMIE